MTELKPQTNNPWSHLEHEMWVVGLLEVLLSKIKLVGGPQMPTYLCTHYLIRQNFVFIEVGGQKSKVF